MKNIFDISLLLLIIVAAILAIGCYALGFSFLAAPIEIGGLFLVKSIASLAKDALFLPLKPLMYTLIILSISSAVAISEGSLGVKFIRVFSYMMTFSLLGAGVAIFLFSVFSDISIFSAPESLGAMGSNTQQNVMPLALKLYSIITSPLMVSIFGGLLFGRILKSKGLGQKADEISDLFIVAFRNFLQITIPLAVFGSITLALNSSGGVETLKSLLPLVPIYALAMGLVWITMVIVTILTLKEKAGFVLKALLPQALISFSTASSIATLPATKQACYDLGADGDESMPFITIGATINMVGTMMSLMLLSFYAMKSFGLDLAISDILVVSFQALIFSTASAAVPSASIVLLQEILISQGVSSEYASYVTALIIAIDTLMLDRLRTTLNSQSDSMSTVMGLNKYRRNR